MVRQKDPHWSNVGEAIVSVEIAGVQREVRQARMRGADGQRLLVWQWNLIGERPLVNDHVAKLVLAFDRVRLQRDDGLSVLIATPYEGAESAEAAATLARFAADMTPAVAHALDRIDGQ
jgi:EpsI family protein